METPGIRCHVVGTEELLVALPADHPLARRRRITREMIADEPVILWPRENGPGMYDRIVSQVWPRGAHIAREEADDEQLLLAVSTGAGIAPVPEGRARALRIPGVRLRHLTAPVPTVDLAVAYPVRAVTPAVQLFLQLALDRSAEADDHRC